MRSELRRQIRTTISVVHITIQLILIWIIFDTKADYVPNSEAIELSIVYELLTIFIVMVGVFAIHFSLMKLFSNSHHSHSK